MIKHRHHLPSKWSSKPNFNQQATNKNRIRLQIKFVSPSRRKANCWSSGNNN